MTAADPTRESSFQTRSLIPCARAHFSSRGLIWRTVRPVPRSRLPVWFVFTLAALCAGCAGQASPTLIQTPADAERAVGRFVEVRGVAEQEKVSAMVSTGAFAVFCLAIWRWSDERYGKKVMVRGKLELTDELTSHDPGVQGLGGPVFVIRHCEVR
jgi:hypothetical protein